MGDDGQLQILVTAELKDVRRYGLDKLDEFDGTTGKPKVPPTPQLERAAKQVPDYTDRLTRSAAVELLLRHEIPQISANSCREWLPLSFGLTKETRGKSSPERRIAAFKLSGSQSKNVFERSDNGTEVNAISVLAAQIVADLFREPEASNSTPSGAEPTSHPDNSTAIPDPLPIISPDRALLLRSTDGIASLRLWSENLASLGYDKEATQARVLELASDDERPEVAHRLLSLLAFIQAEFYVPYFDTVPWSTMPDDALAVAALSGGWRAGFKDAAFELIYDHEHGYHDEARERRAKHGARKAKGNRERARAALISFAERGCLAIPPGRTILIINGINRYVKMPYKFNSRRYHFETNMEMSELIATFRTAARKGGRLDLLGRWEDIDVLRMAATIEEDWNRRHDEVNQMQRQAAAAHALMFDALRNSTLEEIQAAHPLAMLQIARTIRFILQFGMRNERIEVATYVLELQTGKRQAVTGASQEVLSLLMTDLYQYGVRATDPPQLADQLAQLVTRGTERQDLSGSDLLTRSRVRAETGR